MLVMTRPRLFAWGTGKTLVTEKLSTLESVDALPVRRTLALLLFSFRKLEMNWDLMSDEQVRQEGGRLEFLGVIHEIGDGEIEFMESFTKRE